MKEENQRLSVAMKKLKEKQGDKESNIEVKDQKKTNDKKQQKTVEKGQSAHYWIEKPNITQICVQLNVNQLTDFGWNNSLTKNKSKSDAFAIELVQLRLF